MFTRPTTNPLLDRQHVVPRLRRAFLAGSVALIAITLTFIGLSVAHNASWKWVIRSRDLSRLARDARALATDRETGLRGYLLSGKEISLAPAIEAKPLLRQKIDSLVYMTRSNVSQNERAKAIRNAVRLWEAGYAEPTLVRARKGGYTPGEDSELAGKALFDNVRASFETFQNFEERLYARLVAWESFLRKVAFGAVTIEVVLLLGVLFGLRRGTLRQATDLVEQQETLEEQATELEEQLLQAQKMEAVGRLAGGIAHDFNNILTAIKSYSELLIEDMASNNGRVEDVQEIREAADRAANLTRQLLAFSRQQILRPRVLDLNSTVRDLKSMLDRLIGADIELKTRLAADIGMITADPGQVEQVLVNLVVNARDAMPDGGRIDMETANVELDDKYARTHVATPPGPYVMLSVSDTGHGMTRETQARVFEPFFTTKEKGKGTGLGLSTVYGIVKQSGGSIWVYSEPGRGTTFKIYLPRVNEDADVPVAAPVTNGKGGDETILLVGDEDSVREVASRILRRHGYTVVEARNGTEPLKQFTEGGSEFDLIVTDIVMPEMGGLELAQRVREWTPNARILFTSGYTEDAVLRRNFLDPGAEFVEKPFTPARLAQRAREVLDAPVTVLARAGNGK